MEKLGSVVKEQLSGAGLDSIKSFHTDTQNVIRMQSLYQRALVAIDENTGVQRFPMLDTNAKAIGAIWTQLNPDQAYAEDLSGFETAYALWLHRNPNARSASPVGATPPVTPQPGAGSSGVDAVLQAVRGQGPNGTIAGGSSGHDGTSPLAAQAAFARDLINPGGEQEVELGFDR